MAEKKSDMREKLSNEEINLLLIGGRAKDEKRLREIAREEGIDEEEVLKEFREMMEPLEVGEKIGGIMSNMKEIEKALDFYNMEYRNPKLRKLTLSVLYSLHPDRSETSSSDLKWPADKWPDVDKPGVYLVLDQEKKVLYVGKASLGRTIGSRLLTHFQYAKDGSKSCVPVGAWSRPPSYVITIGVDKAFEAPSLEEYLIKTLRPSDNALGMTKCDSLGK
jgi:hypothetical protein